MFHIVPFGDTKPQEAEEDYEDEEDDGEEEDDGQTDPDDYEGGDDEDNNDDEEEENGKENLPSENKVEEKPEEEENVIPLPEAPHEIHNAEEKNEAKNEDDILQPEENHEEDRQPEENHKEDGQLEENHEEDSQPEERHEEDRQPEERHEEIPPEERHEEIPTEEEVHKLAEEHEHHYEEKEKVETIHKTEEEDTQQPEEHKNAIDHENGAHSPESNKSENETPPENIPKFQVPETTHSQPTQIEENKSKEASKPEETSNFLHNIPLHSGAGQWEEPIHEKEQAESSENLEPQPPRRPLGRGYRRRFRNRYKPTIPPIGEDVTIKNQTVVYKAEHIDPNLRYKLDNRTEIQTINQSLPDNIDILNKTIIEDTVQSKFDENYHVHNKTIVEISERIYPDSKATLNRTTYTYTWNKTEDPEIRTHVDEIPIGGIFTITKNETVEEEYPPDHSIYETYNRTDGRYYRPCSKTDTTTPCRQKEIRYDIEERRQTETNVEQTRQPTTANYQIDLTPTLRYETTPRDRLGSRINTNPVLEIARPRGETQPPTIKDYEPDEGK